MTKLVASTLGTVAAGAMCLGLAAACSVSDSDKFNAGLSLQEQARHQVWADLRRQQMEASERDSQVLVRARAEVGQVGAQTPAHKMPKEAAICFAARDMVDADLRAAMRPGHDYAAELATWHIERRAVNLFCAYAFTIGAEE